MFAAARRSALRCRTRGAGPRRTEHGLVSRLVVDVDDAGRDSLGQGASPSIGSPSGDAEQDQSRSRCPRRASPPRRYWVNGRQARPRSEDLVRVRRHSWGDTAALSGGFRTALRRCRAARRAPARRSTSRARGSWRVDDRRDRSEGHLVGSGVPTGRFAAFSASRLTYSHERSVHKGGGPVGHADLSMVRNEPHAPADTARRGGIRPTVSADCRELEWTGDEMVDGQRADPAAGARGTVKRRSNRTSGGVTSAAPRLVAGQHVQKQWGQAGLPKAADDRHAAGRRPCGVRLEDDRVAPRKRRRAPNFCCSGGMARISGTLERCDHADHAHRRVLRPTQRGTSLGRSSPYESPRQRAAFITLLRAEVGFELRLRRHRTRSPGGSRSGWRRVGDDSSRRDAGSRPNRCGRRRPSPLGGSGDAGRRGQTSCGVAMPMRQISARWLVRERPRRQRCLASSRDVEGLAVPGRVVSRVTTTPHHRDLSAALDPEIDDSFLEPNLWRGVARSSMGAVTCVRTAEQASG